MSEPMIGPVDEPPKDGIFRDWDGAQHDPERVAAGEAEGLNATDYIEGDDGEVTPL